MSHPKYAYPSYYPAQHGNYHQRPPYQGPPAAMAPPHNFPDQLVVLDLKATCGWDEDQKDEHGRRPKQEIVEFTSILVDATTGRPKSSTIFHKFITPIEHPILSAFCKVYNGIEQDDVEQRKGAVTLSEALLLHQAWMMKESNNGGDGPDGGGGGGNVNVNRSPAAVAGATAAVTWGNWDCNTMVKECNRKNLRVPDYFTRWVNLKTPFEARYGGGHSGKSVKEAMDATGEEELEWVGAIKGGESHARNKARLLAALISQGSSLAITNWQFHPPAAAAAAAAAPN